MRVPSPPSRPLLALLAALPALGGCHLLPGGEIPVTPQRPTLSSNTATTARGTYELEAGVALDPGDSLDTPVVLKYGLEEATEVFAGWSPLRLVDRPGDDGEGIGDLVLGLRHRLSEETEDRPATAVQAAIKLPTADEDQGLGTGEADFFLAGIASRTVGTVPLTGYYQLGLLGEQDGDGADLQHALALAAGFPLEGRFDAFAELAAVLEPENDFDAVFTTLGLTYLLQPGQVADVSVVLGLDRDAPDYVLQVGFTQNLGR